MKSDKCNCVANLIISPDAGRDTSWVIQKNVINKIKTLWMHLDDDLKIYDLNDKEFGYKGIRIDCCENKWFVYKKIVLRKKVNIISKKIDKQESIENLIFQAMPDDKMDFFKPFLLKNT